MPLTSPHTPLAVNAQWKGKSGLNTYADFVIETDAVVGRVLAALERSGAAGHTFVLFTSDNGCAPYIGADELEKKGHYPSGPLRGYKSDVWEGGHRVPFIVRWPGAVKAGAVCHQLVHQADLLATCADIIGATLPANAGEDSVSFLPLLSGEEKPVREHAISQSMRGLLSIRRGQWKLIAGRGSGGWSKGQDEHPAQLYNLEDDLAETRNLWAEKGAIATELTTLLEKLVNDGRSTPGPPQKNDVPVKWRRFLPQEASPGNGGRPSK
jgi:arylsulfatase A-like enzyme